MDSQTIIPTDHRGRLPRMHYDALREPSPTTRADLIAWGIAQRDERGVSATLGGVTMMTMMAVMKNKAPTSRLEGLPAAMLGAIETAADDLHTIVREFGYDPTGVEQFRTSCLAIIMERIAPLTYDLSAEGDPLADKTASRDNLHQVIGMAAVGTTLAAALTGQADAQSTLDALMLAFDESDNPEIKDVLSAAAVQLGEAIDRKREG